MSFCIIQKKRMRHIEEDVILQSGKNLFPIFLYNAESCFKHKSEVIKSQR